MLLLGTFLLLMVVGFPVAFAMLISGLVYIAPVISPLLTLTSSRNITGQGLSY
jgi:hypothetical protein